MEREDARVKSCGLIKYATYLDSYQISILVRARPQRRYQHDHDGLIRGRHNILIWSKQVYGMVSKTVSR
ncbi:hypothetical protein J7T55_003365 [Diaporthe amygdali]|uniref:uncharacterized protein n=1 Tax=Phomopsis amygdali TaxID=1214568 RepID=UPI0022FE78EA|nr:uncharacterized protein J7T55_003365 [Diaporthe amygdali]KAJ0116951.1 hypothetical protein J7T55_003365 [Diaporthe amygdali]